MVAGGQLRILRLLGLAILLTAAHLYRGRLLHWQSVARKQCSGNQKALAVAEYGDQPGHPGVFQVLRLFHR